MWYKIKGKSFESFERKRILRFDDDIVIFTKNEKESNRMGTTFKGIRLNQQT